MDEIEQVKVELHYEPIEDFLIDMKKIFIIKGEYFEQQDTIDSIFGKVMDDIMEENIKYIFIKTYKSIEDLENDKEFEVIGG